MPEGGQGIGPTGRYSPLRYPGGKGKLSKFMAAVVRANGGSDGRYIEPYAGGAGIAWQLLITGVVRRVLINDIPFLNRRRYIPDPSAEIVGVAKNARPEGKQGWTEDRKKEIFRNPKDVSTIDLGLSLLLPEQDEPIGHPERRRNWRPEAGRKVADGREVQPRESHSPDHEDRRMRRAH